jgi:HK97 family phage major capsid protein|nr:MAG TPA: major capsid protein [Caudoviricetes sp.]
MAFYDSLKLEKGMYNSGFTKTLESIDPSEAYEGSDLAGLDAYERQLKRFNIKVKGQNSDIVDSFFQTTDSAVLFPEFVKRSVLMGMEAFNTLPSIVATVTNVENNDYRTIKSTTDSTAGNATSETNELPKTVIQTKTSLVTMKKRGRIIATSYEALRHKRLDLFAVTLRKIGADIARAQLGDAVDVLINGDESGTAAAAVSPVSSSEIAYADLVELWANLSGYELNTILANTETMQALLALSELKDAQTLLNFKGAGQVVTPLGATLHRVDAVADNTIVGFDKNCALEMVQVGDLIVDYDKLIDKQLERATVSATAGFAKIFADSAKKMTYTTA